MWGNTSHAEICAQRNKYTAFRCTNWNMRFRAWNMYVGSFFKHHTNICSQWLVYSLTIFLGQTDLRFCSSVSNPKHNNHNKTDEIFHLTKFCPPVRGDVTYSVCWLCFLLLSQFLAQWNTQRQRTCPFLVLRDGEREKMKMMMNDEGYKGNVRLFYILLRLMKENQYKQTNQ